MAAPRKYPEELRERAIRMAVDLRRDPATKTGVLRRVGEQLGINSETLRNWVGQAEIDEGHRPGVTTAEAQGIAELERENRELRRANEILRTASASFRRGGARPQAEVTTALLVDYIDRHRERFGVETPEPDKESTGEWFGCGGGWAGRGAERSGFVVELAGA